MLSRRGQALMHIHSPELDIVAAHDSNPYKAESNPEGIVSLAWADNTLPEDVLLEKLEDEKFWQPNKKRLFEYPLMGGQLNTRQSVCAFAQRYFRAEIPLDPEYLVTFTGLQSTHDAVAFAVMDEHDLILCASPLYYRLQNDFGERAQCRIRDVPMRYEDNQFHMDVSCYEEVYQKATENGEVVRALLIVNPHNPLGLIYGKEQLMPLLHFAAKHELYVLVNETYGMSVFDGQFQSALSYWKDLPDPDRTIWMWGTSKTFCMPGLRFGVALSLNSQVQLALRRMEFLQCNDVTQNIVRHLLTDFDWIDNVFLPQNFSRLLEAFKYTKQRLNSMGLTVVGGQSGFFVAVDFRKFLTGKTFLAEKELDLKIRSHGLLLNKTFCAEPGWFRIVFTGERKALEIGMDRLQNALEALNK